MDIFNNLSSHIRVPGPEDKIFKDECPFSFETPASESGVYICMKNYVALGAKMLRVYHENTGHRAFLKYKIEKNFKISEKTIEHPTKLAIGVPGGFEFPEDRYVVTEHWWLVRLPEGDSFSIPNPLPNQLPSDTSHLDKFDMPKPLAACISAIQCPKSAIIAEEHARSKATWEEDNVCIISQYGMNLVQVADGVHIPPSGWKCAKCDLRENLWLNLTDGAILCGRKFWNNFGGNNHALEHYKQTGNPLVVKLGTITPKSGEVYSYPEDSMVVDPKLAEHLAHFGIDIMCMQKTDKTMAEVEIAANERIGEWLTLQESNSTLTPRYGPGMTGLKNLGNTCYMNVILQLFSALPHFRWYYSDRLPVWCTQAMEQFLRHTDSINLVHNVGLQFAKLLHGLCSGNHSWLPPQNLEQLTQGPVPALPGIAPILFRYLIGLHSKTFATCSQQDASEFCVFLLELLQRHTKLDGPLTVLNSHRQTRQIVSPIQPLEFAVEDRLQCGLTKKVRYTIEKQLVLNIPIPMEAVINKDEVKAYKARQLEAQANGIRLPPEDEVLPQVRFEDCLSTWITERLIEDFKTPASVPPGARTHALHSSKLINFPHYLLIQLDRFIVGENWQPIKLDVEVEFPFDQSDKSNVQIDLSKLAANIEGRANEEVMQDSNEGDQSNVVNMEMVNALTQMGFTMEACKKACRNTQSRDLESATNWLMEHLDDPTLNNPEEQDQNFSVDNSALEMMMSMGFTKEQSIAALRHMNNDLEAATDFALNNPDGLGALITSQSNKVAPNQPVTSITNHADKQEFINSNSLVDGKPTYALIAFVSHMGKSATDGHYVIHVKRSSLAKSVLNEAPVYHPGSPICGGDDNEWIIFNDDKVAKSEHPPVKRAYLYVFRRLDAPSD